MIVDTHLESSSFLPLYIVSVNIIMSPDVELNISDAHWETSTSSQIGLKYCNFLTSSLQIRSHLINSLFI